MYVIMQDDNLYIIQSPATAAFKYFEPMLSLAT